MKTTPPAKALEHVFHAVFLQLLIGVFPAVVLPFFFHNGGVIVIPEQALGGIFAMLSVNTWLYLDRYKRSLAVSASGA